MQKAKLIVILGPTASGKSDIAVSLAKKFNGEVVSADSRQVYKGMDIGTGKYLPKNSNFQFSVFNKEMSFYTISGIKIWGYDLVDPKEDFSVSQYINFAKKIITDIYSRGKIPIVVGGTGFYIKAIIDGIQTADVPKNKSLRDKLEKKEAVELFEILARIDPIHAGSMNLSDKKNPRRLIRAIEIGEWNLDHKKDSKKSMEVNQVSDIDGPFLFQTSIFNYPTLVLEVGLTASKKELSKMIQRRVEERLDLGIEEEIKQLLGRGVKWSDQSMASLGYRQWREYYEDRERDRDRDRNRDRDRERDRIIEVWKKEEVKYASRQMTWFNKDNRIIWFDIGKANWQKKVENVVKKWYSSS